MAIGEKNTSHDTDRLSFSNQVGVEKWKTGEEINKNAWGNRGKLKLQAKDMFTGGKNCRRKGKRWTSTTLIKTLYPEILHTYKKYFSCNYQTKIILICTLQMINLIPVLQGGLLWSESVTENK